MGDVAAPEVAGYCFGLRVSSKGTRTFQLLYRIGGKPRRQDIGHYPEMSIEDAQEAARALLKTVKAGLDPK